MYNMIVKKNIEYLFYKKKKVCQFGSESQGLYSVDVDTYILFVNDDLTSANRSRSKFLWFVSSQLKPYQLDHFFNINHLIHKEKIS